MSVLAHCVVIEKVGSDFVLKAKANAVPADCTNLDLSITSDAEPYVTKIEPNAFVGLTQLETINLKDNFVREIAEGTFSNLQTPLKTLNLEVVDPLSIYPGELVGIPVSDITIKEEHKCLGYSFKFTGDKVLERNPDLTATACNEIKLNNMQIKSINADAFSDMTALTSVELNYNSLSMFPHLVNFPSTVTKFSLMNNMLDLGALGEHAFMKLENVEQLFLSKSKITSLHNKTMGHLKGSSDDNIDLSIELDGNLIGVLDNNTFIGFGTNDYVNLLDNPIQCCASIDELLRIDQTVGSGVIGYNCSDRDANWVNHPNSATCSDPDVIPPAPLSGGAIAGIVIGVLIFVALMVGGGVLVWMWQKKTKKLIEERDAAMEAAGGDGAEQLLGDASTDQLTSEHSV